jgi:hypothetical protein
MGDLFEYQNILEAVQHIAKDLAEIKAKICGQPGAPAVVGMQAEPALPKFKKVKGSRRWTERDESDLIAGVARGLDYDTIADGLDRTAKAVENKVSEMKTAGRWPARLASK